MNGAGWNLLWEHGDADAATEPSEERERLPAPRSARAARRATVAEGGDLALAWAGRASGLQARLGNHAVQLLLEPSTASSKDGGTDVAAAIPGATRATPAERGARPAHDLDEPVSPRSVEKGWATGLHEESPPAAVQAESVPAPVQTESETVHAEPAPARDEPVVAPEPLPEPALRALSSEAAARQAAVLARFLHTLSAGVSTTDWVTLATSLGETPDAAVESAVRAIVERVQDLSAARRRRVDRQLAILATSPVVADLASRVLARLAAMSPPVPQPTPPTADD